MMKPFDHSDHEWRKMFLCARHRTPENVQIVREFGNGKPTCGSFYDINVRCNGKTVIFCSKCWWPSFQCSSGWSCMKPCLFPD